MNNEELKTKITELLPAATFDESGEWLNINVGPVDWLSFANQLRNNDSLYFDYLFLPYLHRLEDTPDDGVSSQFYQASP